MTSQNCIAVNLSDDENLVFETLAARSKVFKAWFAQYTICELLERSVRDALQLPLPFLRQGEERKKWTCRIRKCRK